jgi:hypothetical protein
MGFFKDLFSDDNHINEKSIIGFASFTIMTVFAIADIVTGYMGKELIITDFIFNSFLIMTLGCFGIASVDKYINAKKEGKEKEDETSNTQTQYYGDDEVID